jgi:hypothetical protein
MEVGGALWLHPLVVCVSLSILVASLALVAVLLTLVPPEARQLQALNFVRDIILGRQPPRG